jgi:ABC-2 type transport system permease protein
MIRRHVVQAIFRRNFLSYFGAPTGYVYISVFIFISAIFTFWSDTFFTNNLANLDTLNRWFPLVLLFFIPAVSMATWAEERKQGTDELLLTLPAADLEIVVGKYMATLGIYSVALVFSLTNVIALSFLGHPDIGVMIGTYLGYWFLGGALIPVAMVASLLTSSQTVAFILGALFCAVPISLSKAGNISSGRLQGWLEGMGIDTSFGDLASGVVSLRSILYFASLAVVFIYINLGLVVRRRRGTLLDVTFPTEQSMFGILGRRLGFHLSVRTLSLLVMGISLGILAGRVGGRVDLTQERLHTLTDPTREIIRKVDPSRPVYIQAYVSPEVPESYVEQRETLLGLLKEYDAIGGDRIHLRIVETERYSTEARLAEDQFGIRPESVRQAAEGDEDVEAIFMGVAFTCGTEEVVIPFFHRGLSVEYELTRSIGTVSGAKRRKIGVANTDARLFGGLDFQTMSSQGEWQILSELKKQYEVIQVGLDTPIVDKVDVLLVAQVSSLTQLQMNMLLTYIKQGGAALLFDDPFPAFNPRLAPGEPKQNPRQGGMMGMMPPPPGEPKGDMARFYSELGIVFPGETIVWDTYNPHPRFHRAPREILFVGKERFNASEPITSGLQEMVAIYSGEVHSTGTAPLTFTPLLTTTPVSGGLFKSQLFQQSFMGMSRVEPQYRPRGQEITLAARVKGTIPGTPPGKDGMPGGPPANINIVFVADLDCIGNEFFSMRNEGPEGLQLDNVTFVLNCVDVLAGDESYVGLRKRRPKHRTLEKFEELTKTHNQQMLDETKVAEEKAEKELKEAQARLDAKVDEVRKRTDLDERQKEMQVQNLQQVEQKRFQVSQREIEERKKGAIERSKSTMKQSVSSIKKFIRNLAVFLAPIPALLMGLYMFTRRLAAQGRAS